MAAGMTASMPYESAWIINADNPQGGCSAGNYDHNGLFSWTSNLDDQLDRFPDGCNSRFRAMCMTGNYETTTPAPYEPPIGTTSGFWG